MKVGFVTCVQLGLSCIEVIYEVGGSLDVAVTLHDNRMRNKSGRIYLDQFCEQHGVPLIKVDSINETSCIESLKAFSLDWIFVIGWSQVAGGEILELPHRGVLGMHPTLLPEGRGRAAVPWAILKGLSRTGVTLFRLDEGIDTGPILLQEEIPLNNSVSATELYDQVNIVHQSLMREAWPLLDQEDLQFAVQNESKATFWPERKPVDGEIKSNMTRHEAERLVRAVSRPYPGAYLIEGGRKLIVWRARIPDPGDPVEGVKVIDCCDGPLICDEYDVVSF